MRTVGIYIYPQAEVLDFSGPFEVLSTANRCASAPLFDVKLIADQPGPVLARGGYSVNPHASFADAPPLDILLVSGGVHEPELAKPQVLQWLKRTAEQAEIIAAVCTGVFLLAEAGIVRTETVTTHWQDIADLRRRYSGLRVVGDQRWVDAGRIITSGGISAGIDMSLYVLSRLTDLALAEKTARQMEYGWQKTT